MTDPAAFVGKVTELTVERTGADGSAQLDFVLTPANADLQPQSFAVMSNVAPQAFTGMTVLTAAYAANLLVTVAYAPGDLQKAISVKLGGPVESKPGRMGFV